MRCHFSSLSGCILKIPVLLFIFSTLHIIYQYFLVNLSCSFNTKKYFRTFYVVSLKTTWFFYPKHVVLTNVKVIDVYKTTYSVEMSLDLTSTECIWIGFQVKENLFRGKNQFQFKHYLSEFQNNIFYLHSQKMLFTENKFMFEKRNFRSCIVIQHFCKIFLYFLRFFKSSVQKL